MRKIDGANNYLKNQSRKYLGRSILSLLFFSLIFGLTCYSALFHMRRIGVIEGIGFVASIIVLMVFQYYQRKYRIYKSGRQGEKEVINTLTKSLNDDHYLINGAYLKGKGGDIDHIVLGPNGVYVLETKNWSGKIICNGDQWQRPGKHIKSNPSLQIKRNTQKIKKVLDNTHTFQGHKIWVEGIIVFTNPHADLTVNNTTVTILKLQQLSNYIKNQNNNCLTKDQIQKIVKQIQNT
ncbi:MAG: NERD domain-containing protein [Candidatus Bathyarchaeota archaeon]|nr:NERD domain-containing protein [Candidatus Termiticorpusculum sp.]